MLQVVSTGAYYPPVDTTWKILTTGASQLTAGALCTGQRQTIIGLVSNKKDMKVAIWMPGAGAA